MEAREYEKDLPTCSPIKTLQQLLAWSPQSDSLCVSKQPLLPRVCQSSHPFTLVCHDMKSGYLEDKYLQSIQKKDGYRFFNWQYVDLFVYFSHHFVTIPPVGWVSAAHCNRVPILGTMITENNEGFQICKELLFSQKNYENVAQKLVEIAKFYNMDGWLLNIENAIQVEYIAKLAEFVSCLTTKMSEVVPNAKVIWYDSVTRKGHLQWQDELNFNNELFFDKCHGIFLNYCWNGNKLNKSKQLCSNKGREFDVYVGIDVFGRGCYGGGGYNSDKALEIIRKAGLSAAIFANGWVYECQPVEEFLQNEIRFWNLLHPLCSVHCPSSLPLSTSFCHGYGHKYFLNGECLSNKEWVSMGMQQIQSVQRSLPSKDDVCAEMYLDDSFLGGGSLKISRKTQGSKNHLCSIFHCKMVVKEKLLVSFCVKPLVDGSRNEFIQLTFNDKDNKPYKTILTADTVGLPKNEVKKIIADTDIYIVPENRLNGWKQHYFLLEESNVPCELIDISVGIMQNIMEPFSFLLGQIQVIPMKGSQRYSVNITDLRAIYVSDTKKIITDWQCSDMSLVHYYNIYVTIPDQQQQLVGQSISCKLVCSYSAEREEEQHKFCDITLTVQPVMRNGWVIPTNCCVSTHLQK